MIIVLVRVKIRADAIDSMREAIETMERTSRDEAGCQDYSFAIEITDSAMLRVTERWDDMAALEYHFSTPHMATFNAAIGGVAAGPLDVKVYEVAREVGLPGNS